MTRGSHQFGRARLLLPLLIVLFGLPLAAVHASRDVQQTLFGPAQSYAGQLAEAFVAGHDLRGVVEIENPTALTYDHGVPAYVMVVRDAGRVASPATGPPSSNEAPAIAIAGSVAALSYQGVAQNVPDSDRPVAFVMRGSGGFPFDRPVGDHQQWVCSAPRPVALSVLSGDRANSEIVSPGVRGCVLLDPRHAGAVRWDAWAPPVAISVLAAIVALVVAVGPKRTGRWLRNRFRGRRGRVMIMSTGCALVITGVIAGLAAYRSWHDYVFDDARASVTTVMSQIAADDKLDWKSALVPWTDRHSLLGGEVIGGEPTTKAPWPATAVVSSLGRIVQANAPKTVADQLRVTIGDTDIQRVRWPDTASTGSRDHWIRAVCSYSSTAGAVDSKELTGSPDPLQPDEVVRACLFLDPGFVRSATLRVGSQLAVILLGVAVVMPLVAWLVMTLRLRPVVQFRRALAEAQSRSNPTEIAWVRRGDELDEMADLVNVSTKRLRVSLESQRQFVTDAAHELRSPLATLINTLEIAGRYPQTDDPERTRTVALRQARRLEHLTADLLALAQLDAATPLRHDPVDLSQVARDVCAAVDNPSISIRLVSACSVFVRGDQSAFERAACNLVENACRHAVTEVVVTVSSTEALARLQVFNDGSTIPEQFRERIFERFVRVDEARSRTEGGAGLGLAIARETARRYGGDIVVASCSDGTTFTLELPADRP